MKLNYQIALFLMLALMTISVNTHAQTDPMAKWKPNVGDEFKFHWISTSNQGFSEDDTVVFNILNIDYKYDSLHSHLVVAEKFKGPTDMGPIYYWYQPSQVSISTQHSFFIATNENWFRDSDIGTFGDTLDFGDSILTDSIVTIGFNRYLSFWGSGHPWMWYAPDIHWFVEGYGGHISSDEEPVIDTWQGTLIEAITSSSSVHNSDVPSSSIELSSSHQFIILNLNREEGLDIMLLDLLGRHIHSWQLPIASGQRQITLNVADVPSGVYFLRISGDRIDEVKKVCITH